MDRAVARWRDPSAAGDRQAPGRGAGPGLSAGREPAGREQERTTASPRELVVERDGLRIAVLDWGGDGEPLLLLHPNGFCAGVFDPLARRLTDRFRPIGVDLRGHGGSDTPRSGPAALAFDHMAADVEAVLEHLGIDDFVALGESLGGGVATVLDGRIPGAMSRLLLCEAIVFDLATLGATRPEHVEREGQNFMATVARKRRAVWPDRATVRDSYGARPPLDAFAPEALDAYVRWGFVDRPDGQVELACAPEIEASIFELSADERGAHGAWERLGHTAAEVVVAHGDASMLPAPWFEAQAARVGRPAVVVAGGHFFLQEDTARAEALVRAYLA